MISDGGGGPLLFSLLILHWPTGATPFLQAILEKVTLAVRPSLNHPKSGRRSERAGVPRAQPLPALSLWVCPVPPSPRKGLEQFPFPTCLDLSFLAQVALLRKPSTAGRAFGDWQSYMLLKYSSLEDLKTSYKKQGLCQLWEDPEKEGHVPSGWHL